MDPEGSLQRSQSLPIFPAEPDEFSLMPSHPTSLTSILILP